MVDIKLVGPQLGAFKAFRPGRTVSIPWGRGGGKTWFVIEPGILRNVAKWEGITRPGMPHPGVRIVVVYPATTQARKTILPRFEGAIQGGWKFLGGDINWQDLRCSFPGGSWVQFVSQEQRDLVRGLRTDIVATDETDDIDQDFYDGVVSPWFTEGFSLKMALLGGTPLRGRNGLLYRTHKLGLSRFEGHRTFHARSVDFPAPYVDHAYVERQRRIHERNGKLATFQREYECSFDAGEGLVYPHFTEEVHVRDPLPGTNWTEWLIGGDHGYEDPAVRLTIAVAGHGNDAIAWVVDEFYKSHKQPLEMLAVDKKIHQSVPSGRTRWYLDPSRPDMIAQTRGLGARVNEAINDIEPGVTTVAKMLGVRETEDGRKFARLYVSPKCVNTIAELTNYRRKKDRRSGEFSDDIEDKNNHAMDALRYALHTRFGGPSGRRNDYGSGDFTAG